MAAPYSPVPAPGAKPARRSGTIMPDHFAPALITVGSIALLMIVVQVVNAMLMSSNGVGLVRFGIESRDLGGLVGVLTAPMIHGSWGHLWANLIPFLVFGILLFVGGVRQFVAVTIVVWLVSGVGVWLFGPSNTLTVGASGLVFGWLAYLVARGVFTRNWAQIAIGVVLLFLWGGIFWTGIVSTAWQDITGDPGVSWQGHLFGAIGGVLAAFLVARADKDTDRAVKGRAALPS